MLPSVAYLKRMSGSFKTLNALKSGVCDTYSMGMIADTSGCIGLLRYWPESACTSLTDLVQKKREQFAQEWARVSAIAIAIRTAFAFDFLQNT